MFSLGAVAGEEENIERMVALYHGARRHHGRPGETLPALESLNLARAVLSDSVTLPSEELSYEGYLKVAKRLKERYGYRFNNPPFEKQEFAQWAETRRNLMNGTPDSDWIFDAVRDQLEDRIEQEQRKFKVPITEVKFRTSIRPGADQRISLNQRAGKLDRLGELYEAIATTATGRELMKDFLPLLEKGEVTIEPLTPELIEEASRDMETHLRISALARINPATGKAVIYVNADTESGLLLPQLVHEITHVVDFEGRARSKGLRLRAERLRERINASAEIVAAERGIAVDKVPFNLLNDDARAASLELAGEFEKDRQHHLLRLESLAYGNEDKFRAEFIKLFPEAAGYYNAHFKGVQPRRASTRRIGSRGPIR